MISKQWEVSKVMIDGHVHIERGEYTLEWIRRFADRAIEKNIEEIWLLEHCYRFKEFVPMYYSVCRYSDYINKWFQNKAGVKKLDEYLELMEKVRQEDLGVKIMFGLEVCYFKKYEEFVYDLTKDKEFDFLLGSVHFVDDFAFDHKAEHWEGKDVDEIYTQFFETSIDLVKSNVYDGIAHPDSIKLFGHKTYFPLNEYYKELAFQLARNNMYAEQSSGIYRRYLDTAELGMNKDMLKAMKKQNVKIVTASDAHEPDDVGYMITKLSNSILSV